MHKEKGNVGLLAWVLFLCCRQSSRGKEGRILWDVMRNQITVNTSGVPTLTKPVF